MGFLKDDDIVKGSFKRVREHILALEREVRANREFIIAQNNRIEGLEKEILNLLKSLKEDSSKDKITVKEDFREDLEDYNQNKEVSSAKEGINHSRVQSSKEAMGFLAAPRRHFDTLATTFRHPVTDSGTLLQSSDIEEIKAKLNKVFLSLTNREFKVFMAIYSLEEQHNSPIVYSELAKSLDLSSSSIRDYVSELIRKSAPIKKEKSRNGVAYLSVLPEFKSLNLISKLIAFRNMSQEQKSLFDSFF